MSVIRSFILAFSMFSRIPVPKAEWNEKNMRYMMAFFPLVGTVIGLILMGWGEFAASVKMSKVLFSCGMTLIPVAVTGGIHLDGFCDTADALASHAAPERKQAILKDHHVGSFAVISVCCYLLLYFSLCYDLELNRDTLIMFVCVHTLSRVLSGFSMIMLPSDSNKGTDNAFAASSDKAVVCIILVGLLICCEITAVFISPIGGGLILLNGACCFLMLKRMAQKDFEGMRGDIAGFFLQINEIISLVCIIVSQKMDFM